MWLSCCDLGMQTLPLGSPSPCSIAHRSSTFVFFFFLIYLLFLAVLGLRFCARAFSSCGERGPLFIAVRGPLTVAASLVAEHRLQMRRLSSCGSQAQLFRGLWDLPRPGLEPVSPALAGRFSTTAPPGKPYICLFIHIAFPEQRLCCITFSLFSILHWFVSSQW